MRSSSPGAARWPIPCISSAAKRPYTSSPPPLPPPVRLGFRVVGKRFLRSYPYEEAFFLPYARQFLDALSMPLILLGGITELATIEAALAEGFAFVAMARALLREPDLPNRMRDGRASASLCIHCNKCMPTIYSGTRCVLVREPPRKE